MIHPVILCGGSGTRLWPLSRKSYPKQFLDLTGSGFSMLQQTLQRLQGLQDLSAPIVVCNQDNRFLVAQQLHELGIEDGCILLEPVAKNTAPAVACAAVKALQADPDATLLVLPADHLVGDVPALTLAINAAIESAEAGHLVTFGVAPKHPETGYGYIKKGDSLAGTQANRIAEFKEKPDLATAKQYLASGDYSWNSGMFVFKARRYADELGKFAPEILENSRLAVESARVDLDFVCLDESSFSQCPEDSIDYAVMERTQDSAVVELDAAWSDIGSWSSLWDEMDKDTDGNRAQGDVTMLDTKDSFVHSESRLVTTLGVSDTVVVETADAILVADKSKVQNVKDVVSALKAQGRDESTTHKVVYRPWGSYETICLSERFQVKKIVVNPGQKLSLQMHHHRAEHWIVVQGTAEVTCEDKVFALCEDQSTYIPLGHKHRLENPGKIPLELIEVQSGSYLGEDDIVRFDDVYGRNEKENS